MKKYFSIFLSVCLLVSLVAITGCSLWGYDDDDGVVAPAATMSASGVIDIPGDGIGASNLRGAVTLASNLKAQAYMYTLVSGVATETAVGSPVDVSVTDGKYTVTFPVEAGYYFVKITSADNANFKMLKMLGTLATTDTTVTANVDSESTAVGLVVLLTTNALIEPTAVSAADVAAVKTAVETAIAGTGDVEAVVPTVAVTAVALNKTTAGIVVGATEALTATITPTYATNKAVTWTSSAAAIASVNATGVVTGVAAGVATITVTTTDGSFVSNCLVTVTVAVSSVALNKNTTTIAINASETLIATVAPATATNKTVTWSSSNTAVATVNAAGRVNALTAGTATITVTTADGSKTATCVVTVPAAPIVVTEVATVTFNNSVTGVVDLDLKVDIEGFPGTFTTTTTTVAYTGGTFNLTKSVALSTSTKIRLLAAGTNPLDPKTLTSFQQLTFTPAIPVGSTVKVYQGTTLVATSNNIPAN